MSFASPPNRRPLRVLFLDAELRLGGSEQLLLTLMRGLRERGDTTYLLYRDPGALLDGFRQQAQAVWQESDLAPLTVRRPLAVWRSLRALRRVASVARADALVVANPGFFSLVGAFRRLGGCAVLAHLGWPLRQRSPLYRRTLGWIDAGVTPAARIRQQWSDLGWPAGRLHVVPNGIDTARFRPAEDRVELRRRLRLEAERSVVVFVGRVVRDKGVFTLLRAWALVQPVRAELRIIGPAEPAFLAELQAQAQNHKLPAESWSYVGATSRSEEWLAAADLAVVPSENDEPFGLAAVEAMACQTVTVVSDSGALPNLLPAADRTRCVFPQGDAEALAARLRDWLAAPTGVRKEAAQRGAEHARWSFDGGRMTDHYATVLHDITAKRGCASPSDPGW